MPPSKYTAEQKTAALNLWRELGPAEAARQTGIPIKTITSWGRRSGLQSDAPAATRAATEAARLLAAEKRALAQAGILDMILAALERHAAPHQEFVGQKGREVVFDRAPAAAFQAYSKSIEALVRTLRLEEGEATSRKEVVERDDFDREVARLVGELEHGRTAPVPVVDDSEA